MLGNLLILIFLRRLISMFLRARFGDFSLWFMFLLRFWKHSHHIHWKIKSWKFMVNIFLHRLLICFLCMINRVFILSLLIKFRVCGEFLSIQISINCDLNLKTFRRALVARGLFKGRDRSIMILIVQGDIFTILFLYIIGYPGMF